MTSNAIVVELGVGEGAALEGGWIPVPMIIPFWGYMGGAFSAGAAFGWNFLGPELAGRSR